MKNKDWVLADLEIIRKFSWKLKQVQKAGSDSLSSPAGRTGRPRPDPARGLAQLEPLVVVLLLAGVGVVVAVGHAADAGGGVVANPARGILLFLALHFLFFVLVFSVPV